MIFKRWFNQARRQSGFTLVELLVGIAITGLVAGGVTVAISQIVTIQASSTSRMTAVKQIETAIDALRKDVMVAQYVTLDSGETGFPLVLTWTEWSDEETNNSKHIITYTLDSDTDELKREESITTSDDEDEETITSRAMAKHIESISIQLEEDDEDEDEAESSSYILEITITAGLEGQRPVSETRTFDILPRPLQSISED